MKAPVLMPIWSRSDRKWQGIKNFIEDAFLEGAEHPQKQLYKTMIINQKVRVFPELLTCESYDNLSWEPFRQGVEIHSLYKDDLGASAALLRYEAGAKVPHHSHSGYEHIFVLSGSQSDANGKYCKGDVIINSPHTSHQVSSEEGCVVLIVWERPVIID